MVFFLTAALYAAARYLVEDERDRASRECSRAPRLLTLAYLAKAGRRTRASCRCSRMVGERVRAGGCRLVPHSIAVLVVAAAARSGALRSAGRLVCRVALGQRHHAACTFCRRCATRLRSRSGASRKISTHFRIVLRMLRDTMLGTTFRSRSRSLPSSLAVDARAQPRRCSGPGSSRGLLYVFVVVTVERVDYYMLPLLPLGALRHRRRSPRVLSQTIRRRRRCADARATRCSRSSRSSRWRALAQARAPVAPYYGYNKSRVSQRRRSRSRRCRMHALVVIGALRPRRAILHRPIRMGRGSGCSGPRSTKRARSARARATSFRSKTAGCSRISSSARGCSVSRVRDARGWPVYETDPAKNRRRRRALLARVPQGRTRRAGPMRSSDARGLCVKGSPSRRSRRSFRAARGTPRARRRCCRGTDNPARSTKKSTRPIKKLRPPIISCCMSVRSKPKR